MHAIYSSLLFIQESNITNSIFKSAMKYEF